MAVQRGNNPAGGILEGFLQQVGLPVPQEVFLELQRVNASLEKAMPDIHKLAESSGALSSLAAAMERFKPEDLRNLTKALQEASQTGEKLYKKLWSGGG